jgi:ferritin
MLSDKMRDALNEQINAEMYSAYMYLSMATYLEDNNYAGMSSWMKAQAQEEMFHAMKFYGFINDRRARVTLKQIDAPPTEWESPLAVFKDAFAHEQKVTGLIHKLVDMAEQEKDHATRSFLQWFVDEQVEEESSTDEIVQKLTMVGDKVQGLYIIDRELGGRKGGGEGE